MKPLTQLFPYQLKGARQIHQFKGRALLADEMGLGKSIQALYYCYKMVHQRPILVVCPAPLKYVWHREALRHFNIHSSILSGLLPPRHHHLMGVDSILIINYEILHKWTDYLIDVRPRIVIWDEAHYLQNHLTRRFKYLQRILVEAEVPYRIALSGTPFTNRHAELWSTLNLLRPDVYASFQAYGWKYCRPRSAHGTIEFYGSKNGDILHRNLKRLCMIRRMKKDVAKELPTKVRRLVPVELSRKAKEEYDFCQNHFLRWLQMRHPTRVHRARKALRVVKIGYLLRLAAKLKRHAVAEWIDNFHANSEGKLVVFSMHRPMVHWLHARHPQSSVIIDGSVTGLKRMRAVDLFQDRESVRDVYCNLKAAGVGLTLHRASNVLYTDFPWTPGALKQGEDRIHRIGQKEPCTVWFLAAVGTIEEKLCQILVEKQEVLDQALDGITSGKDFEVFEQLYKLTT